MSKIRLVISEVELTEGSIVIKKMEIIDTISGEHIKIAKINYQLLEFLKMVEIELDDYSKFMDLKAKNPTITKLCETFKLYT